MDILLNILLSVLGLILATLWGTQKYIVNGGFNWKTFVSQNKVRWIWVMAFCAVVAVAMGLDSNVAQAITTMTGFDFDGQAGAYITMAVLTYGLTKKKKGSEASNSQ